MKLDDVPMGTAFRNNPDSHHFSEAEPFAVILAGEAEPCWLDYFSITCQ